MKVVLLAGGVGGSKIADGIAAHLAGDLTVIVLCSPAIAATVNALTSDRVNA